MIVDMNLLSRDLDMDFKPSAYSSDRFRTLLVASWALFRM
jgi:hypothetical protein